MDTVADVPVMLVVLVPVLHGRSHPGRDAEADPHGLVDHGDSAVAGGHGDRRPVVQVERVPQVPSWRSQLCSHSCTW